MSSRLTNNIPSFEFTNNCNSASTHSILLGPVIDNSLALKCRNLFEILSQSLPYKTQIVNIYLPFPQLFLSNVSAMFLLQINSAICIGKPNPLPSSTSTPSTTPISTQPRWAKWLFFSCEFDFLFHMIQKNSISCIIQPLNYTHNLSTARWHDVPCCKIHSFQPCQTSPDTRWCCRNNAFMRNDGMEQSTNCDHSFTIWLG